MERYRCKSCGSEDIEISVWVNPNTGKIVDTFYEEDLCRCNYCCEESKYEKYNIGVKYA